jgi:hypothetical protein
MKCISMRQINICYKTFYWIIGCDFGLKVIRNFNNLPKQRQSGDAKHQLRSLSFFLPSWGSALPGVGAEGGEGAKKKLLFCDSSFFIS